MSASISLTEAIELLEILDIESTQVDDLRAIGRRAKRRWHPDRISYQNPSEERLRKYNQNFARIDDALEVIRAFLSGKAEVSPKARFKNRGPEVTPEEAVRRHAPANQDTVRSAWNRVKETSFHMTLEEVVLSEGRTVKDLLDDDLNDEIPATALASLWIGLVIFMVVGLVASVLPAIIGATAGSIVLIGVTLAWFVQAGASIVALIPLCRFWLPDKYLAVVGQIVDKTVAIMYRTEEETWSIWVFGIPMMLILATNWAIIRPIYKLAGLVFSDKILGRNVVSMKYYAGLSEDYLEYLVNGDVRAFTAEELFHLAHAASELGRVR